MKKKILTALVLSAMMAATFASCGDVKKDEKDSSNKDSVAANNDDNVTADEDTTAEEVKPEEPTPEEDSSAPEEKTDSEPETQPDTEPDMTLHEFWISEIEEHTFENGSSFRDLADSGFANVYEEGKAYAVVRSDGAAGSIYYKVYNSTDGGKNWLECETYREANGDNTHIALDDGGMLLFSYHTARNEVYPAASYLYFDGIGIKAVELEDVLAETTLDDGRILKDVENAFYDITYSGGYKVSVKIADSETGEDIYDGSFDFTAAVENAMSAQ